MFGRQQRGLKGRAVATGLAVLAPAALFGGLPAVAQEKGEIAVMLPAAGDPYFKLKSFGYVDEGEKLGYEVTIYDAGGYGNLSRQVSQIEDVIQRGVDAIVLVPASSDGTVPVVEKAVDNGIPVINDGIATNTPKVTGFVGEDLYVMGEMLGVYIAEALGGKGNIAMLSGPAGLDLTNFRVSGFKDYIALFPELQVVAEKFTSTSSAENHERHAGLPAGASGDERGLHVQRADRDRRGAGAEGRGAAAGRRGGHDHGPRGRDRALDAGWLDSDDRGQPAGQHGAPRGASSRRGSPG